MWEHLFKSSTLLNLYIHVLVSFCCLNFKLPWCRKVQIHLPCLLEFWLSSRCLLVILKRLLLAFWQCWRTKQSHQPLWVWIKISLVQVSLLRIMFDSQSLERIRCTSKCDLFWGIYAHEISHELHVLDPRVTNVFLDAWAELRWIMEIHGMNEDHRCQGFLRGRIYENCWMENVLEQHERVQQSKVNYIQ